MVKSIRWRLQIWYSLVLIAVVSGFAAILYVRARATTFREIDSRLEASIRYLDADLRSFPGHLLEGRPAPVDFAPKRKDDEEPDSPNDEQPEAPPPKKKKFGKDRPGPFPLRKTDDHLMQKLSVPLQISATAVTAGRAEQYFSIWLFNGTLLKSEGPSGSEVMPDDDSPGPDFRYRGSHREITMRGPQRTRILVGISTAREEEELQIFVWQLGLAGLGALAIGLVGGWLISRRIFRPIAAMSAAASEISAANLSGRLDAEHVETELAGLARVLNATFDRLEEAFKRQAQFTADASHELRTPIAIIRSHAQLALDRTRTPEEYRQTIESCLNAANRMASIIEGLLSLARADAGQGTSEKQSVELGVLLADAIALIRPLAEAKGISLTADLAQARVLANPTELMQVINNLLGNAIQYNRPRGSIRVRLLALDSVAIFTVTDTGCGIPEADQPHIFERFYRVDKARARDSGGTGLGLSICKNIVEAHGGTIGFETKVDSGTTFFVRLPTSGE